MRGQINERSLKIADEVVSVANELGVTPTQVAIAWVRQAKANIVPLVGARTVEQLEDNLGCLNVELSADHKERLDKVSAISPGFPMDMLMATTQPQLERVDNHRRWNTDLQ